MPTARTLRLNELLQRELSGFLHANREYQSEAVAITIAGVDVKADFSEARVFVAVTGDAKLAEDRLRWLRERACPSFRFALSRLVLLRRSPALVFELDTATARGNRLLGLLDEIAAREKSAPPTADEPGGEPPSPRRSRRARANQCGRTCLRPDESADGAIPNLYAHRSFTAPIRRASLRGLAGRRPVVWSSGHARPDGDCIGSQVALARVLRALGHGAICANPDPVPRRLAFCVGDTPFVRLDGLPAGEWSAIFVDCADLNRAGDRVAARFPAPLACFDHHLSNPGFAAAQFLSTTDSAATCEILAALFPAGRV